jgi:ABC-type tungstate transport system substrate-binding protein
MQSILFFITPITIILSALPQAILSFSLACTQLSNWKQHTLLVGLLLSYVPQILGFILYVLPSSAYKKEFGETTIAKKNFKWMFKTNVKKLNA